MEDVRLLVEDKKAEAARKSSSRSDTVSNDDPMDLVEVVDNCILNQSSTEKNPDSQLPRRFHICIEFSPEAPDAELDDDENEDNTESS